MELNDRQMNALIHAPDTDMSLSEAKRLYKAAKVERKRSVPNIFTTLSGRAQPRQGFLSVEILRAIYLRSEVVRACVDSLIEMVVSLPWTIQPVDEERTKWLEKNRPDEFKDQRKRIKWARKFFDRPSAKETLDDFHRRILRDLLIYDAAAYEVVIADYGNRTLPVELGAIAGDTVELECDDAGIVTRFWQSYNVLHRTPYEWDEIAYMQLNPCNWQPYGISPIETAFVSITSDLNAGKYNADFFSSNGVAAGVLAVLGVNKDEYTRLTAQMRAAKNDNPWNVLTVRGQRNPDGSAQKVFEYEPFAQQSNRDMQFTEMLDFVARRVCMAYKVTPSLISMTDDMGGGIGNGIAESQDALMQAKGVAPLLRKLESTHTLNVLQEVCHWPDLEFKYTSSGTPEEDKAYDRSVQEVQGGIATINEHRLKFGGRAPVSWGDAPATALPGFQPPGQPPGMPPMGGPAPGGQPPGLQKAAEKKIIIRW